MCKKTEVSLLASSKLFLFTPVIFFFLTLFSLNESTELLHHLPVLSKSHKSVVEALCVKIEQEPH